MTESEAREWQQHLDFEEGRDVFDKEGSPSPPRWRPADFRFRLAGVMDARSASRDARNSSMPLRSETHQNRKTKETN